MRRSFSATKCAVSSSVACEAGWQRGQKGDGEDMLLVALLPF